ncbi:Uncharacterized protein Fot_33703 [Forsythia ovata]|uniref:Uncharacterized protein n=1 Tax=Forsythia ovata TaxID=205694 RepID=A0ABD1TBK1_9LAMI
MHTGGSKSFMKHAVEDQMKELADMVTDEGSSMCSTGHDDIFTQVMGPDSRGRKRCFGRATFPGELSNTTSNRDNAEIRSLKGKVVDIEEELKSTKEELKNTQQQCYDLQSTTNALQDSLKATMDEIAMMRRYFRLFLPDGISNKIAMQTEEFGYDPKDNDLQNVTHRKRGRQRQRRTIEQDILDLKLDNARMKAALELLENQSFQHEPKRSRTQRSPSRSGSIKSRRTQDDSPILNEKNSRIQERPRASRVENSVASFSVFLRLGARSSVARPQSLSSWRSEPSDDHREKKMDSRAADVRLND